jgi:hypothetical protein
MPKPLTPWTTSTKQASAWSRVATSTTSAWTKATASASTSWAKAVKPDSSWSKLFSGFIPQPYDSAQLQYDSTTRAYDGVPYDKTPTHWTQQ